MTTINYKKKISSRTSINIVRDFAEFLDYHVTPNTQNIFDQIINDFRAGIHAFNIIGTYGVGKSAFFWALANDIIGKTSFFREKQSKKVGQFEIVNLVGEFDSMVDTFGRYFVSGTIKEHKSKTIISKLDEQYKKLALKKTGLIILIDELGKFLEYAALNNPGREMYFIQQLAEFVSAPGKNIILVTTLHQDFSGYAGTLTKSQQNEWDKVRGRLKEITFNEPVEQLLYLAAERINGPVETSVTKRLKPLVKVIEESKAFPLNDYLTLDISARILPFDVLSLSVLTLALQKYGQNERSLFSFLESNDRFGLKDFNKNWDGYYHVAMVYDYLAHNFYSHLNTTKNNVHYAQWAAIKSAIERTEALLGDKVNSAVKLVKTIGLLNIFASASRKLDNSFLTAYAKLSIGIQDSEKLIKVLEQLRIIRFVKHLNTYILFEGTALNIEMAIDEAGNLIERVSSVINHLNRYFDFPYETAKSAYFERGTPRLFAYHLSEQPFAGVPQGEVDGYINLIFSELVNEAEVQAQSQATNEAILYGWYLNTNEIKAQIFEIDKVKKVIETNSDDVVAVKELKMIQQHHVALLNHYVLGSIYSPNTVRWYFQGEKQEFTDRRSFNRILSHICNCVYPQTPVYKNELLNKTNLSSSIATARKRFIAALINDWDKKDLGFPDKRFPPEKTIYLTLLKETNLHIQNAEGYQLGLADGQTSPFAAIWAESIQFLETTRTGKRNLQDLGKLLTTRPYKMKKGLVDFWLSFFLFATRERYAIFHKDVFIPAISQSNLELIVKDPDEYTIKAFNIEGIRLEIFNSYRRIVQLSEKDSPAGPEFLQTIRPFLSFYRDLPPYAKNTERLSPSALALRSAIALSKDPEEVFFEQFPKALGYNMTDLRNDNAKLNSYIQGLQTGIRSIRSVYDDLLQRIEQYVESMIAGDKGFPAYQEAIQHRYKKVKQHLLLPQHKVFYQRLFSEMEDRNSWLASMVQACIGVQPRDMDDKDENLFYEKFGDMLHDMDNLVELSQADIDSTKEIVYQLEVKSLLKDLRKNLVRLPVSKTEEISQLRYSIQLKLTSDRQVNIATLASLLEDMLSVNEKG